MRKQSKQLILLLLVFVLLVGGYFGLQKIYKAHDDNLRAQDGTVLLDFDRDAITSFSFDYEGETHSLEKKDEVWYYTADNSKELNQNRVLAILNKVSPLKYEQEITDVTDMVQYGLDNPSKVITVNTDSVSKTIEVGNFNSMASIYYVRFPGETTVYVVKAQYITTFDRNLDDLLVTPSTEGSAATGSAAAQ